MFDLLKGIGRAVVGTALLPVDLAVDIVALPVRAYDGKEPPLASTSKRMGQIGDALDAAMED